MPRFLACGALALTLLIASPGVARADSTRSLQWMVDDLDLTTAHDISTGEGVTIGLVDTGVNAEHPDLVGSVDPGMASFDDSGDGLTDVQGHGTAMASLAVGHGHGSDGEDGVLGAAPGARILSAAIMPPENLEEARAGGSWFTGAEVAPAVRWLADNGADVILMSISGEFGRPTRDAIAYAIDKGVPVIACSGNIDPHGETIREPADIEGVIAVAGTDATGAAWDGATIGPEVALSAPAADVVVADYQGGYANYYGTSNSAAIVAGVAALMLSLWPDMSVEDLTWRLTRTAEDRGEVGRDDAFGHGVVDPVAALTAMVEPPPDRPDADVNPAPIGTLVGRDAPLDGPSVVVGAGGVLVVLWVGVVVMVARRRRTTAVVATVPAQAEPSWSAPPSASEPSRNLSGPRHWP